MTQVYSDPSRETDPHALPDVEVFHRPDYDLGTDADHAPNCPYRHAGECDCRPDPGWYWWSCFPGCLPDGEPVGPFETEEEAIADAQE
jgi:hypothetical protein